MANVERLTGTFPQVQEVLKSTNPHIEAIRKAEVELGNIIITIAEQAQKAKEIRSPYLYSLYLSVSLDVMQRILLESPLSDTCAGNLAVEIIDLHRRNAGEQTEILFSQARVYKSETEDYSSACLALHNNYGSSPQGELAESGLLIQFDLNFVPDGINWLEMQLHQRQNNANRQLYDRFRALSRLDHLTVMWLFMDASYQAVTAVPILAE